MMLFVTIVHIIVCLMLIGIILLQPGRGMGLSASFSDSSAQSVFGTKTADVLTKATTVAAVLFMVTCLGLSALTAHKSRSLYSGFKNQAPITMEQVQKAVKEAQQKTAEKNAPTATATPAAAPTAEVPPVAQVVAEASEPPKAA